MISRVNALDDDYEDDYVKEFCHFVARPWRQARQACKFWCKYSLINCVSSRSTWESARKRNFQQASESFLSFLSLIFNQAQSVIATSFIAHEGTRASEFNFRFLSRLMCFFRIPNGFAMEKKAGKNHLMALDILYPFLSLTLLFSSSSLSHTSLKMTLRIPPLPAHQSNSTFRLLPLPSHFLSFCETRKFFIRSLRYFLLL